MTDMIPFNRPYTTGNELERMAEALGHGHVSGDGAFTRRASERIAALTGAEHALLTTSCTHALEMQAILAGIGPGDEVIMPSFTFVSTANAIALRGAVPVFVDIRADTFNIDESLIESAITERTKAIVVVHYAGVACEMTPILDLARRRGLLVFEDAAHAFGATYRGRRLGSLGDMGALSFHETKNIHCGEGGALLLSNDDWFERAEILREKGTNRSRFFRGQVDKYTWVDIGSSYLPSDLLAAFLSAQLDDFDDIQRQRMDVWLTYREGLADVAASQGLRFQHVPDHCAHPAHLFACLLPDIQARTRFIEHMDAAAIRCVFHYVPLHSSPQGRCFGDAELPVTDDVSDRLIRLPLYAGLSRDDVERVVDRVNEFRT